MSHMVKSCGSNQEAQFELHAELNEVFNKWLNRHQLQPEFHAIQEIQCLSILGIKRSEHSKQYKKTLRR